LFFFSRFRKTIEQLTAELTNTQEVIAINSTQNHQMKTEYEKQLKEKDVLILQTEQQLSSKILENKKQDIEIFTLQEQMKIKENEIQELKKIEILYKEEQSKNDQLSGKLSILEFCLH
jgi:hypothetical protein